MDPKPRRFWQIHLSTAVLAMLVASAWIGLFIPSRISYHWDDYLYLGVATAIMLFPVVCFFEWIVRWREAREDAPASSLWHIPLTVAVLLLIFGANMLRIHLSGRHGWPGGISFFEWPAELLPERPPKSTPAATPYSRVFVDTCVNLAIILAALAVSELIVRIRKPRTDGNRN